MCFKLKRGEGEVSKCTRDGPSNDCGNGAQQGGEEEERRTKNEDSDTVNVSRASSFPLLMVSHWQRERDNTKFVCVRGRHFFKSRSQLSLSFGVLE